MRFAKYTLLVGMLFVTTAAEAQTPASGGCNNPVRLNPRILSDAHSALWRALSTVQRAKASGLVRATSLDDAMCADSLPFIRTWTETASSHMFELLPVQVAERSNSAYPRTENDGAAWLGVGLNFGATAGFVSRWKFLTLRAAPEFYYQQNKPFTFARNTRTGFSEFGTPYQSYIDYPTRFGSASFNTVSAGQSFLQATVRNLDVVASMENVWMGSADVYPILSSNTAPGYPHLRMGTHAPIKLPFVRVEIQLLMGSVSESKYFDGNSSNDSHYFTTTMLTVQPNFLPGLSLGVARAYHDTADALGQNVRFYIDRIIETPFGGASRGNRVGNALGILFGRWVLPESQFEAYAEWAREDTPGTWVDVLREPDWTQAYVLGFQKTFVSAQRARRLYGELVHLGESAPARAGRGFFSYYTHSTVIQGHTNDGQLLGAAIGPGSDAQLIGFDAWSATARTAFRVQRTRYDDDTYYRSFARRWGEGRHDAEITLSAERMQLLHGIEIEAGLAFSRRYGRQFIPLPSEAPDLAESNVSTHLAARWRPH